MDSVHPQLSVCGEWEKKPSLIELRYYDSEFNPEELEILKHANVDSIYL